MLAIFPKSKNNFKRIHCFVTSNFLKKKLEYWAQKNSKTLWPTFPRHFFIQSAPSAPFLFSFLVYSATKPNSFHLAPKNVVSSAHPSRSRDISASIYRQNEKKQVAAQPLGADANLCKSIERQSQSTQSSFNYANRVPFYANFMQIPWRDWINKKIAGKRKCRKINHWIKLERGRIDKASRLSPYGR